MDSYEKFFERFKETYLNKEAFFQFGMEETIYAPFEAAQESWNNLKHRIYNNQKIYIRGFGRNASRSYLFKGCYTSIFQNDLITIDPTNNSEPRKTIELLTNYAKNKAKHKPIQNYQVSHVFGRTKNVFAFTAPWNIAYIPKILDPFTGHEAKGEMVLQYQQEFQKRTYILFKPLIDDYNEIMQSRAFKEKLEQYILTLSDKERSEFEKAALQEFKPIFF